MQNLFRSLNYAGPGSGGAGIQGMQYVKCAKALRAYADGVVVTKLYGGGEELFPLPEDEGYVGPGPNS